MEDDCLLVLELADDGGEHRVEGAGRDMRGAFDVAADMIWMINRLVNHSYNRIVTGGLERRVCLGLAVDGRQLGESSPSSRTSMMAMVGSPLCSARRSPDSFAAEMRCRFATDAIVRAFAVIIGEMREMVSGCGCGGRERRDAVVVFDFDAAGGANRQR